MSGTQLERSVLEAKEREELVAIADALGTKPAARAKKADLVTQILRATGVASDGDDPGESKPRRGRPRKAVADRAESPQASVPDAEAPVAERNRPDSQPDGDASSDSGVEGSDEYEETPEGLAGADPDATGRSNGSSSGSRQDNGSATSDRGTSDAGASDAGSRHFDTEPGNRRNRRRRGRDRFDRGSERELPGQTSDSNYSGEPIPVHGFLDMREEGYGFLRTDGFLSGPGDVYVSISQVRRFALRRGDYLEGAARPAGGNEKYPALLRIDTVSGLTPEQARERPRFDALTPLFPDTKLHLEVPGDTANVTARIVDLISPIGKGQRGLIVSPPKAGKTTILKQIAHSIEANNPDVHLMVLLVDERPEEVTDMRRSVKGEVIASTFDRPAEEHTQVAELAIERAKRMVEVGRDVVIVLDGITRLARAYNLAQPATGRIFERWTSPTTSSTRATTSGRDSKTARSASVLPISLRTPSATLSSFRCLR